MKQSALATVIFFILIMFFPKREELFASIFAKLNYKVVSIDNLEQQLTASERLYVVTEITDASSFYINDEQHVDLIGIQPFESSDDQSLNDCYMSKAKEYLEDEILNHMIILERSAKKSNDINCYGCWLRYAYHDEVLLNETIVRDGYAKVSIDPIDSKYQERLIAAEHNAHSAGRGLWGKACK